MDYLLTKADMDLYYYMVLYGLLAVSIKNDRFLWNIALVKKENDAKDRRSRRNFGNFPA